MPGASLCCRGCARRGWLLARLSASLDYAHSDLPRLIELLSLEDEPLLDALAGRRRETLRSGYEAFAIAGGECGAGAERICRHDRGYPDALRNAAAPPMLNVRGGAARLRELVARPAVAVVGTRKPSDYGLEVAASLGRGLAASGLTVVAGLTDGVARAAHEGVLEASGRSIAVAGGGLDAARRGRHRSLIERLGADGCIVSELPCDCEGRRWAQLASERIVARLAQLTVVVEARDSARDLACPWIARAVGRAVAAVPGRVSSRSSRGTNALLAEGAPVVRGAEDVLELLHARPAGERPPTEPEVRHLDPRLAEVLERVGEGRDSPDLLVDADGGAGEMLLALSELELLGLLTRGHGGRYVPRGWSS